MFTTAGITACNTPWQLYGLAAVHTYHLSHQHPSVRNISPHRDDLPEKNTLELDHGKR